VNEILAGKQLEYQKYLENPDSNGLIYGSSAMRGRVRLGNALCFYLEHEREPGGMILPKTPRETVFDLTLEEWAATHDLLHQARALQQAELAPDGYTIGWNVSPVGGQNVPVAHLHIVPRFAVEPYAGRGLRWWLKQPENLIQHALRNTHKLG
jgi:diadenosine tetraphosphate (Ap4A) HIT family hydrolase